MTRFVTIPAPVVPLLYSGLQLDICHGILPELDELYIQLGREEHPEWFTQPYHRLDLARELLLVIDWLRDHPVVEVDVDIDQFRETLLSGLQAELEVQRDHRDVKENGPELREKAAQAVVTIENFLTDFHQGRLPQRRLLKRPSARMVERAIVLQLTRNDHTAQWCRAELEHALHDVEALAVNDALERLGAQGVIDLDGEHAEASMALRHLDGLKMVSI